MKINLETIVCVVTTAGVHIDEVFMFDGVQAAENRFRREARRIIPDIDKVYLECELESGCCCNAGRGVFITWPNFRAIIDKKMRKIARENHTHMIRSGNIVRGTAARKACCRTVGNA